jgi:hypothetical protein
MGGTHAQDYLRTSDHCSTRRTGRGTAGYLSANCFGHLRWPDRECRPCAPSGAPNRAPCGSSALSDAVLAILPSKEAPLTESSADTGSFSSFRSGWFHKGDPQRSVIEEANSALFQGGLNRSLFVVCVARNCFSKSIRVESPTLASWPIRLASNLTRPARLYTVPASSPARSFRFQSRDLCSLGQNEGKGKPREVDAQSTAAAKKYKPIDIDHAAS